MLEARLVKRLFTFVSAMWGSLVWWWNGYDVIATPDEAWEREAICVQCPRFDHRHGTCRECGCFVMAKTLLLREKCPIGQWSAVKRHTQKDS